MYRRTLSRLGVFSVFVDELKKVPAYFSYKAQTGAKAYVDSASQTMDFLKGEDPSENPEMREKRRRHKETYQAILNQQAAKAAEENAKVQQERAQLSWKEKLQLSLQEAKEAMQQMTSSKAGVMALLQHCTASHAAEVAIEQGIDVKNVQMVFEKVAAKNAVGFEEVVVGYIEAPSATQEEVMAFAEKLHKACPVANTMHIQWHHGRADAHDRAGEGVRRADTLQEEMDCAARQVDRESSGGGTVAGQASASPRATAPEMPRGMPGARRVYPSAPRRTTSRGFDDEAEAFHLPGVKSHKREPTAADAPTGESASAGKSGDSAATPHSSSTPTDDGAAPQDSPQANKK